MSATELGTGEARLAALGGDGKRAYVRRMFSEIAPRYDLLNHLLSFNIDRRWRARALAALGWERRPAGRYLDLCAGTLDVGAQLLRAPGFRGTVIGADFAEPMLRAGKGKGPRDRLIPVAADAVELPLPDQCIDGATVTFGIRNVADLDAALSEMFRVLTPGARFVILEFSVPRSAFIRTGYNAYFHHVLPVIGGLVSGHRTAYRYLPESVETFPTTSALAARMRDAGFAQVAWRSLTLGVVAIHVGERP